MSVKHCSLVDVRFGFPVLEPLRMNRHQLRHRLQHGQQLVEHRCRQLLLVRQLLCHECVLGDRLLLFVQSLIARYRAAAGEGERALGRWRGGRARSPCRRGVSVARCSGLPSGEPLGAGISSLNHRMVASLSGSASDTRLFSRGEEAANNGEFTKEPISRRARRVALSLRPRLTASPGDNRCVRACTNGPR